MSVPTRSLSDDSENECDPIPFAAIFLTLEEFSAIIGMAPNTVRDRLKKGSIRGAKSGRLWRIPITEIGRVLG
nr:helix-turn-helix domain-containing protein [uncultured Rhodopila sp.]